MSTINKETYDYYKKAYKASKRYTESKKHYKYDHGEMLSELEWKNYHEHLSNKEIIYLQSHFYTKENAHKIQKSLAKKGYKLTITQIQNRDFSKDMYKEMKDMYDELIKNMSSREASKLISHIYWGSD